MLAQLLIVVVADAGIAYVFGVALVLALAVGVGPSPWKQLCHNGCGDHNHDNDCDGNRQPQGFIIELLRNMPLAAGGTIPICVSKFVKQQPTFAADDGAAVAVGLASLASALVVARS